MDGSGVVADSFTPSFSADTTMPAGGASLSAESEGAFKVKSGEGGGWPDCRELEQDMFTAGCRQSVRVLQAKGVNTEPKHKVVFLFRLRFYSREENRLGRHSLSVN